MKKLALAMIASLSVSFAADAAMQQTKDVKYVGDLAYAGFCKAVINNDVALFKRSVSRFVGPLGGSRKDVLARVLANNNVQCAGKSIKVFAEQRNAKDVSAYIIAKSA